jgi:hypothetical protein
LLGVDGSGAGLCYEPGALHLFDDMEAPRPPGLERFLFWGPEVLYPDGTFAPGMRPIADVPQVEQDESMLWPQRFPAIAAAIRVPVRISIADHERWWVAGAEAMAELRGLFKLSPRVDVAVQPHAGHNISLGRSARAYHLKVLAFAEECILAAGLPV